jgi:hypothetical protein
MCCYLGDKLRNEQVLTTFNRIQPQMELALTEFFNNEPENAVKCSIYFNASTR